MSETMLPNRRHRVPISIAIAAALVVIATLCGVLQLQLSHSPAGSQSRVDDRHVVALNGTSSCAPLHASAAPSSHGCATRPAADAADKLVPGRTRARGARHGS
jgi:hypothetical protein